ncbi:MAG: hypothetical protein LBT16_12765 [Treponema sp.]|jgi:hypothetical protein|nr:hypothetical protein [Treponema sp.]
MNHFLKAMGIFCCFVFFLTGCDGSDFDLVEIIDKNYRGTFDYPYSVDPEAVPTSTVEIEGAMVIISSFSVIIDEEGLEDSILTGTVRFHISSARRMKVLYQPIYIYALYNGTELIGFFYENESNFFYRSDTEYFVRRGYDGPLFVPPSFGSETEP